MQLGRQGFQHQLQQFLAGYPSLLWMSQVQGGMVGQAAKTLDRAADAEQVRQETAHLGFSTSACH